MPFVLIVAGIILLVAAVRDTQQVLFFLVAGDFLGPNNFIYWFLSIVAIGALGYVPKMKPISDGMLILVILVLFLRAKKGFFDQFQAAIKTTQSAKPVVRASSSPLPAGSNIVSIGGSGPTLTLPTSVSVGGVTVNR